MGCVVSINEPSHRSVAALVISLPLRPAFPGGLRRGFSLAATHCPLEFNQTPFC